MNNELMNIITSWLSLIIQGATIITLVYALWKFASKPEKTQDERLEDHERRLEKIEERLDDDSDRFEMLDKGMSVTQSALLAIMDSMINGDAVEELKEARNKLYTYLAEK